MLRFYDVEAEIYLIPLEDEEDQKRLLSMQLTGCAMNECIELSRRPGLGDRRPLRPLSVKSRRRPDLVRRVRRLQRADRGLGLVEDDRSTSALSTGRFSASRAGYPRKPRTSRTCRRNITQRLAENPNRDWVRRYVECEYGEDPSGVAVFRESFKRSFHTADFLEPVSGHPLLIGQDFGRNPCSLICQPDHMGRLLVLEEILANDVGLETHVTRSLKGKLYAERYLGKMFAAVGDPSGVAKGNFLEEDSFDVLRRLGIPAFPAPTNNIDSRLAAVEALLYQQRDGGPAIVIDRGKCPMLVRAMNGAYRFGKTKDGQTRPLPEKSPPMVGPRGLPAICLPGGEFRLCRSDRQAHQAEKFDETAAAGVGDGMDVTFEHSERHRSLSGLSGGSKRWSGP